MCIKCTIFVDANIFFFLSQQLLRFTKFNRFFFNTLLSFIKCELNAFHSRPSVSEYYIIQLMMKYKEHPCRISFVSWMLLFSPVERLRTKPRYSNQTKARKLPFPLPFSDHLFFSFKIFVLPDFLIPSLLSFLHVKKIINLYSFLLNGCIMFLTRCSSFV